MTQIIGRLEDVGIGIETTRGTAVAPTYWLATDEKTHDDKANIVMDDAAHGVLGEVSHAALTRQWADGTIRGSVGQSSIGAFLTLLAGAAPSTSTTLGEYTHTFTQANNVTNKSGTIAYKDGNQDLRFAMAMLDSLTLTMELDQFFKYEANFISKKSATATNTVSRSLENIFAPTYAGVKLAATQGDLGAATAINVRSASVTFAKNAEAKQVLGSADLNDVHNRTLQVTGTLEVYYDNTTYKDYVFSQTERALRLQVVNTGVTLANSSNPRIYIDLYKVRFSDWERQKGNGDLVTETVNFTALVDYSNSQKVYTLELLNSIASY